MNISDVWYSWASTIESWTPQLNTFNEWATIVTVWGGLLGQSIFVAIYATRPWRAYRITRALMLKSVAFWMIFVLSATRLVARGVRPSDDGIGLIFFQLALEALILFAIWNQAFALILEVRRGGDGPHLDEHVVKRSEGN